MNILRNLTILGTTVAFASCGVLDKINQPLSSDGYNPLDKAGTYKKNKDGLISVGSSSLNPGMASGHGFKSGDVVEVAIANTALFKRVPQPGDRYTKVLKVGDSLKVLGTDKDFLKVTNEKGDTGYVSSVMVISQGASLTGGAIPPMGDIAPPPEIPSLSGPDIAPVMPEPVPSITEPVPVDPIAVPSLPDPEPVPMLVDPSPAPKLPTPDVPDPSVAPEPEIPSLPEL